MPRLRLTPEAVRRTLDEYDRLGASVFLKQYGYGEAKSYFLTRAGRRYDSKAIAGVAHGYATSAPALRNDQFSGGEDQVAKHLRRLGFDVIYVPRPSTQAEHHLPALNLPLHGQTTRKEAYALFDIKFDQRQQHLLMGLSPKLPDGGYFVWITLDKTDLEPNYDYEDRLDRSSFTWVTRRGVQDTNPDYANLADRATRVSLFIRSRSRDEFTYFGEMTHHSHYPFTANDGRPQLRYLFELMHSVPEALLRQLYDDIGVAPVRVSSSPTTGTKARSGTPRTRRPTTFGETREALAYVLGDVQRVLVPAHYNYQVRLTGYLKSQGVEAEWERDFIDVRLVVDGQTFIGEIKVTSSLSLDEAFRTALGQVLFYGHMLFDVPPGLVMLLDQTPDAKRLELATKVRVAVVVERTAGVFELLNPSVARALERVFASPTAAPG